MIKLNVQRSKQIKFGVEVAGVEMRDLKGAVRLIHEGIEYGFPIVIVDDTITVEIPALEKIIKEDLKDNTPIEAKLEIIADDVFSTPWADTIRVERPIKVEATLQEVEELQEKIKPNIKAKIVAELESRPEKKKILKEEKPEVVKIVPKWLK
jgi:hypothetical protein